SRLGGEDLLSQVLGSIGFGRSELRPSRRLIERLATASAELSPGRYGGLASGTGEVEFRSALLTEADPVADFEAAGSAANHANSLISACACSIQNRMSISRYIVVAVSRCSCACSRLPVRRYSLPRPRWQWATRGRMPRGSASAIAWR